MLLVAATTQLLRYCGCPSPNPERQVAQKTQVLFFFFES
jgi:hypothetical protein